MYESPPHNEDLSIKKLLKRRLFRAIILIFKMLLALIGIVACLGAVYLWSGDGVYERLFAQYGRACCGVPLTVGLSVLGLVLWRYYRAER